jgi:hypothetical protein
VASLVLDVLLRKAMPQVRMQWVVLDMLRQVVEQVVLVN